MDGQQISPPDVPSRHKKGAGILIAVVLVIAGFWFFGIVGALVGAALASLVLQQFGVVKGTSAWVSETKGVRIAKYIVLVVVLAAIFVFAFYLLK